MKTLSNSDRTRRIATAVAGFIVSLVGVCTAAPAAFALRVVPVGETSTTVPRGGTPGWEIALIVVAAVAVVGLTLALSLRTSAKSRQRQSSRSSRPIQSPLVPRAN